MEKEEKRYFTSRIIENLDSQIRSLPPGAERNILFARKSIALARHSLISEAKRIIQDLRAINTAYEPRLSAWIMFAEGVVEHAATFDFARSRDRIIRAHLVGQAANDPALAGTAAAWLAYFDFVQGKYKDSRDYLEKAFAWSTLDDSEARSRATMVLGFAFYFIGDLTEAKRWLQNARSHAVRSGDIAMQNTILFNSVALQVSRLTLLDCTSTIDPAELKFAVMSSQSAGNLNTALGIINQPSMVPMQRAELYVIEGKWSSAIEVLNAHLDSLVEEGQSKWVPKFFAQRAWCKAKVHDMTGASTDISSALNTLDFCIDPDDLCVVHSRISSSARLIPDDELATKHDKLAKEYLDTLKDHQSIVKEYFTEIANNLNPE
ncbi:MAG: hypothetical protein V4795_08925 [Pseudomonadota bacterium]